MTSEDSFWRTRIFRQSVIMKIDNSVKKCGVATPRNGDEIEQEIFYAATTKEEYLDMVAMLIFHIRSLDGRNDDSQSNFVKEIPKVPHLRKALQIYAVQEKRKAEMRETGSSDENVVNTAEDCFWRSSLFRHSIIKKINEAVEKSGMPIIKTTVAVEDDLFRKASTKEEYLDLVARLILYIREKNVKDNEIALHLNQRDPTMPDAAIVTLPSEDLTWRTKAFRQSVVFKLDETIKETGISLSKSTVSMENDIFHKSGSKEEYMNLAARLILHIKDLSKNPNNRYSG